MRVEHLFARVPVSGRDAAVDFYERLTGRAPDLIPNEREAAWELAPGRWIYVEVDADRAGSGLNTVLIDDLDDFVVELGQRGIAAGPIELVGGSVRQTIVTDGDGNRLKVGQVQGGGDSGAA
jgi:hypothetical protein